MTNVMFICRPVVSSDGSGILAAASTQHTTLDAEPVDAAVAATALPKPVLLRIYGHGSEQLFARDRELFVLNILSCMEVGPRLLATFQNGRFEDFLEDTDTLRAGEVRDNHISRLIAEQMFHLHSLVGIVSPIMDGDQWDEGYLDRIATLPLMKYKSELWRRMYDWYGKAIRAVEIIKEITPDKYRELTAEVDLVALRGHIQELEHRLSRLDSPVVFTHNDVGPPTSRLFPLMLSFPATHNVVTIRKHFTSQVGRQHHHHRLRIRRIQLPLV